METGIKMNRQFFLDSAKAAEIHAWVTLGTIDPSKREKS